MRSSCGRAASSARADARFFWEEDRKRTLASRVADLDRVTFHAALGTYGAKSIRIGARVRVLAERLGFDRTLAERAERAATLTKADLTTGLVGEFPELQGIVGGLLLHAEGADPVVARGVYEHYRPAGADDLLPVEESAALVSVADRLDTLGGLLGAGERPTGSRDPFGLRRAANGVFRIGIDRGWPLSIRDLAALSGGGSPPARRRRRGASRRDLHPRKKTGPRTEAPRRTDAFLGLHGAQRIRELPDDGVVEGVVAIGVVEGDEADGALAFDGDVFGHG